MKFDAVIFDIDNVLVDTRASYTDCIRKTVQTYLEITLKFEPSAKPLLTRRDVENFKSLGGFNDDWDTCYGLLLYFLAFPIKTRTIRELAKRKNIAELAKSVKIRPLRIKGLKTVITSLRAKRSNLKLMDRFVGPRPPRNDDQVISLFRIADIFQRFYHGEFVWNEKLFIPKTFLKQLKKAGLKIGIVTGRSREEANFALRRFKIDSFIDAMMTLDETPKNRKKPDPYGLLKVAGMLGQRRGVLQYAPINFLYVGDLPDDMMAGEHAKRKIKIRSCGFLLAALSPKEMKKNLLSAGADYVARNVSGLKKIIS